MTRDFSMGRPAGEAGPTFWRVVRGACLALVACLVAFATPAAADETPRAYVLGADDVVTVLVYGQQEFNVTTKIKPDGTIVMPLIGTVQAAGKTVLQLIDEVRERLVAGDYLRDPIVNVEVREYNSKFVRVSGRAGRPTLVPLDRSNRLLDVLLRSGWVRGDGANHVIVRRAADGQELTIEVDDLARGVPEADIVLNPDDTVFIPEAERVFLLGAVGRPGAYPMRPGMTVGQLIAGAGGPRPGASSRYVLRRDGKDMRVNDSEVVQAEDVITVRQRMF
ncbi:MAG: polysaccharide biosynthesis/export family protein [Thermaurantiacus sp.]